VIAARDGRVDVAVLLGLHAAAEDDLAARPSHHDALGTHQHDDFESFVVMLPEIDGITVIRRARALGDIPILVLSARGSTGDRILGLTVGADDYLPKPFSPAELVARVRTILRRSEPQRAALSGRLRCGDLDVDVDRQLVTVAGSAVALTALELRLLGAILGAEGRILGRDMLLDAIHGFGEGDVSDRSIDVYVKRLRSKLRDDASAPRYVATVRGAGYRAAGPVIRVENA